MAITNMLDRVKLTLRIKHTALDEDIQSEIDACLTDLELCGIVFAETTDPLVFNAVKLWCKAAYTDDPVKSAEWLRRYEALKSSLMMAEGYAWEDNYE